MEKLGLTVWYEPEAGRPELEFGDCCWRSLWNEDSIGVEIKTSSETLARFQKKELQRQLRGLYSTYDVAIFLMAGRLDVTPDGHCKSFGFSNLMDYNAFRNWLRISLPQDLPGLIVEEVPDERFLIRRLFSLVKYYEKRENKATWAVSERRPLFATNDREEEALSALMPYPKWGEEMARRALEANLSPYDVFHDVMENSGGLTKEVRGIGPERIKEMRRVLGWRPQQ